jgi:HEAT repeat protein
MMRRSIFAFVAVCLGGAAAFAIGEMTVFPQPVQDALTVIDTVPTKIQLDSVFPNGDALPVLAAIAVDKNADTGIRLRAIHALSKYCPEPCSTTELAHQSLSDVIATSRNHSRGSEVLLLRAAIETIGTLEVDDDAALLIQLLDHPSRDIRAATARALRDLCNTQAITPLRVRYTSESTEQVKLAISEALRILAQCTQSP